MTDYCDIDPEYGTMDDFKNLIAACHERGINVIIDLVMNHTSSQHEWFKTAADYLKNLPEGAEPDASECPYVDYYNFSKEMQGGYSKLDGTDWYYEAQFWSEMPDLNLGSQAVRDEFDKIVDFWLDLGVDGFRLEMCIRDSPNTENMQVSMALAAYLAGEDAQKDHYDMRNILPTNTNIAISDDEIATAVTKVMTCLLYTSRCV